jgi:hypothetical protein
MEMEHSRPAILALLTYHRLSLNHFNSVMQKYMQLPKTGRRKIIIT